MTATIEETETTDAESTKSTDAEATDAEATDATDASKTVSGMWLDEARARMYSVPEQFTTALAALYPDGTNVTKTKLLAIEKHATAAADASATSSRRRITPPVAPINWTEVAQRVLTSDGYTAFNALRTERINATATSREIALDKQRARYYRARATWRAKYDVAPHSDVTGEALTALQELEKLNTGGGVNPAADRRFAVHALADVMREHLRPELASRPRALELKPGEVLVTWRTLQNLGSCGTYIERFRDRWPEGTVITKQLCVDNADDFEWAWAASQLLDKGVYRDWETRYYREEEDLRRRSRELRRAYDERRQELLHQREAGTITAAQLREKQTTAREDFERINQIVQRDLRTVHARTFADLYAERPRPDLASHAS